MEDKSDQRNKILVERLINYLVRNVVGLITILSFVYRMVTEINVSALGAERVSLKRSYLNILLIKIFWLKISCIGRIFEKFSIIIVLISYFLALKNELNFTK